MSRRFLRPLVGGLVVLIPAGHAYADLDGGDLGTETVAAEDDEVSSVAETPVAPTPNSPQPAQPPRQGDPTDEPSEGDNCTPFEVVLEGGVTESGGVCVVNQLAPEITPEDLIPGLRSEVVRRLPQPVVSFAPLDPEFGWVYVTVPTDFRVTSSLAPITAEATASPTVWASITATPTTVTFTPGEPGSGPVECSAEDAQLGYDPKFPGACSYTYVNTSAISADGRTFPTSMAITWSITYATPAGSGSLPALTTTSTAALAVAEYQALVTCTGPRPEQGGC